MTITANANGATSVRAACMVSNPDRLYRADRCSGYAESAHAEVTFTNASIALLDEPPSREGRLVAAMHVNEWDRSDELRERVASGT